MELEILIEKMRDTRGISDIHLIAGMVPHFRRDGELQVYGFPVVTSAEISEAILPLMPVRMQERYKHGEGTALATVKMLGVTLRAHLFRERGNACAVLRCAPNSAPRISELGFGDKVTPLLERLTEKPNGLILCVGPSGSGKTTLIASMIEEINQNTAARIHVIEEFVEYGFINAKSLITRQFVWSDVPDHATALRNVLYSDPDVLMVDAIPDLPTLLQVLTLAETGHLVFAQVESNSAAAVLHKIIAGVPEIHRAEIRNRLGNNLIAVLTQQLIPRNNQPGRVPALEILLGTPEVRQKIREGRLDFHAEVTSGRGRELGMQTMNQSIDDLIAQELIAEEVGKNRRMP
jgi:twitching motility protein PilT